MIKPKFEDFDYGKGRKDLSWTQYAKALEEYVAFLEAEDPAFRQSLIVGRSEQLFCDCSQGKGVDIDEDGFPYCIDCQKNIAK